VDQRAGDVIAAVIGDRLDQDVWIRSRIAPAKRSRRLRL
jgi:hypothetical protein